MEDLATRARRILGDSWIDGTMATDLQVALDLIESLRADITAIKANHKQEAADPSERQ